MSFIPLTYRPITTWPGVLTSDRKRSPFASTWPATMDLLDRELWHLDARLIVLQLALSEADIRRDGYPRANSRPSHPGVIIAFESKHGPLQYATDIFTDWQSNVRAIALALEALRKVDRYGITKRGEQYAGWKALPASGSATMGAEEAAGFLVRAAGSISVTYSLQDVLKHVGVVQLLYREAAKRTHPDSGGSVERFQLLQAAKRALDAHHGGGS